MEEPETYPAVTDTEVELVWAVAFRPQRFPQVKAEEHWWQFHEEEVLVPYQHFHQAWIVDQNPVTTAQRAARIKYEVFSNFPQTTGINGRSVRSIYFKLLFIVPHFDNGRSFSW